MSLSYTHGPYPGYTLNVVSGKNTEITLDQRPKQSDRRKNGPQVEEETA